MTAAAPAARDYYQEDEATGRDVPLVCSDCGRPTYWDPADELYHHAATPSAGCFLIPGEERDADPLHPLIVQDEYTNLPAEAHPDYAGKACTWGDDGLCTVCSVAADLCFLCEGIGYHVAGCGESEEAADPEHRDRLWRDVDEATRRVPQLPEYQGYADAEWMHSVGFGNLDDDPPFVPQPPRPSTDYLPKRRNVWRLGILAALASLSVVGFALVVLQCSERYPTS